MNDRQHVYLGGQRSWGKIGLLGAKIGFGDLRTFGQSFDQEGEARLALLKGVRGGLIGVVGLKCVAMLWEACDFVRGY